MARRARIRLSSTRSSLTASTLRFLGGQLQEDRLEIGPDRGQLVEVSPAPGEELGERGRVVGRVHDEAVVDAADVVPGRFECGGTGGEVSQPEAYAAGDPRAHHVLDRAGREQAAMANDRDAVADLLDLRQDVGTEQDRHTGLPEVADRLADLPDARRVETVGGLVEDQQLRRLQQCPGDRQTLLHAE